MNAIHAADELASIKNLAFFSHFCPGFALHARDVEGKYEPPLSLSLHTHTRTRTRTYTHARTLSRFRAAKERKQKTGLELAVQSLAKKTGLGLQHVSLSVQVCLPAKGKWKKRKLALFFNVSPFLSRYLQARGRWQRNWPWSSACPSCTYCASLDPRTGLPANRCDPRSHVVSGRSAMCPPRT